MSAKNALEFVADGRKRARAAAVGTIRAQVTAEYAERLRNAGWFRRLMLKSEMKREIERRIDQVAPPHALYICNAH